MFDACAACGIGSLVEMLRIPASGLPSSKSSGNNKRTGSVLQYLKGLADLQTCSYEMLKNIDKVVPAPINTHTHHIDDIDEQILPYVHPCIHLPI